MSADPVLLGPLYQRVYGLLVQRISDGVYAVGESMPAEGVLAAEFAVSKATVRKAVDELVRRGLVTRKQGSGTYITDGGGALNAAAITGTVEDVIGGTPRLPLLDVQLLPGTAFPKEARSWLGQEEGMLYRVTRGVDGVPVVCSFHYLADRLAEIVTRESLLAEGGMIRLLRSRGTELRLHEQLIAARLADVVVAQALGVPVASPMMLATRELSGLDGPLESTRMWYRGDMLRLEVSLELP